MRVSCGMYVCMYAALLVTYLQSCLAKSKWTTCYTLNSIQSTILIIRIWTTTTSTIQFQSGHGRPQHCLWFARIQTNTYDRLDLFYTRFLLLSLCLILSPRLLLFVSETASSTERRTALTPLESFLSLQFGIFLFSLSLALALNVCLSQICLNY